MKNFKKNSFIIIILFFILNFNNNTIYAEENNISKSEFQIYVNSQKTNIKAYDIDGETFIRITDLQPYMATDLPIKVESNYDKKTHTIIPSTFLSFVKINGNYYVDMDYYKQKYRVDDIFVKSEGLSAPPFINKYRYKYNTVYKVNSKNQPLFEIVDNKSNVIKSIPSINSSNRYNLIQYKDFINNIKFINNFIYENEIIKKETK